MLATAHQGGLTERLRMVRPDRDQIGGHPRDHVEIDESWVGGRTRGAGRGVHDQSLVIAAVEVRQRKPENVTGVPAAAAGMPVVSGWKSCRIVRQKRSMGLLRRRSSSGSWW